MIIKLTNAKVVTFEYEQTIKQREIQIAFEIKTEGFSTKTFCFFLKKTLKKTKQNIRKYEVSPLRLKLKVFQQNLPFTKKKLNRAEGNTRSPENSLFLFVKL